MKTATIHSEDLYGRWVKSVCVYYRGTCLEICATLQEAQEWAKRNGFTHARYSGTFSGKEQPKAGPL